MAESDATETEVSRLSVSSQAPKTLASTIPVMQHNNVFC